MITQQRLLELLHYEPSNGQFTWKVHRHRCRPGAIAGCREDLGYIRIGVDGCYYRAHRLAFLYMTGQFSKGEVDHMNLDKSDNRWANLRAATRSENMGNQKRPSHNTSGIK